MVGRRGTSYPGERAEGEPLYCATFSEEMQLENSFTVGAPPDRVFAYLLDATKIIGCVPGAELTEIVDPTTFKGKVKIKVGPITVAYSGTARIVDRDDAAHAATLEGEGRETTGPGSARAKARMTVEADGSGSIVKIVTDYTIAGRVAQFGRGVMEDVSRRIVKDVAACIKANVEAGEPGSGGGGAGAGPGAGVPRIARFLPELDDLHKALDNKPEGIDEGWMKSVEESVRKLEDALATRGSHSIASAPQMATSRPINAMGLLFSVLWARLAGGNAQERAPMEPLDPATAGIGALLAVSTVVGLALAVAVTYTGLNAIFHFT
jgi:uncharacterized protein